MNSYVTNTELSGQSTAEYSLRLTTNYVATEDEPGSLVLDNLTAPPHKEVISMGFKSLPAVKSGCAIDYPAPVKTGAQFRIQIEDLIKVATTETSSSIGYFEAPVNMYLTVNYSTAGITAADLQEIFQRLVSTLHKSDGSWRFDALMRGALKPTTD